jgi:hypothetical protein
VDGGAQEKRHQRVSLSTVEVVGERDVRARERRQPQPRIDVPSAQRHGPRQERQPEPPKRDAADDPYQPGAARRYPGDRREHEAHGRRLDVVDVDHAVEPERVDVSLEPGIVVNARQILGRLQQDPSRGVVSREAVGVRAGRPSG